MAMTRSWWRVLTALLAAHSVAALFLLPSEHVHLGTADHLFTAPIPPVTKA